MSVQTLKFGNREFVVIPRREFELLSAQARRQAEDEYWTESALRTEARARRRGEKPIPLEEVERELDARKRTRRTARGARHR